MNHFFSSYFSLHFSFLETCPYIRWKPCSLPLSFAALYLSTFRSPFSSSFISLSISFSFSFLLFLFLSSPKRLCFLRNLFHSLSFSVAVILIPNYSPYILTVENMIQQFTEYQTIAVINFKSTGKRFFSPFFFHLAASDGILVDLGREYIVKSVCCHGSYKDSI